MFTEPHMAQEPAEAPEDFMMAVDAARILDLSSDTVRLLARKGRLQPAVQAVRGVRLGAGTCARSELPG